MVRQYSFVNPVTSAVHIYLQKPKSDSNFRPPQVGCSPQRVGESRRFPGVLFRRAPYSTRQADGTVGTPSCVTQHNAVHRPLNQGLNRTVINGQSFSLMENHPSGRRSYQTHDGNDDVVPTLAQIPDTQQQPVSQKSKYLKKKGILSGPTTSFKYSGPEQRCQLWGSRLKMAFPGPVLLPKTTVAN